MAWYNKEERKCKDCGSTEFIEDHAQGDLICQRCGLVAEGNMIDESTEWRSFSDKDGNQGDDPNRVGGPEHHLLQGVGLSTTIQASKNGKEGNQKLTKFNQSINQIDSRMKVLSKITELSDNLNLPANIKLRSQEIYVKMTEENKFPVKKTKALYGSLVYQICKEQGAARPLKEFLAILGNDVAKTDFNKCGVFIQRFMKEKGLAQKHAIQNPADFMVRFLHNLQLNYQKHSNIFRAAQEMALHVSPKVTGDLSTDIKYMRASRPWDGKTPTTLAAAVILQIYRIADLQIDMQTLKEVTGVAASTVQQVCREFKPYLHELVPAWFCSAEDIKKYQIT